jgi:hypothetical protein
MVESSFVEKTMRSVPPAVNPELDRLLRALEPASAENLDLRLRFGLLCAERVAHLLEQPEVIACLSALRAIVAQGSTAGLPALAARADELAHQHPGSKSLDGVGHAAVSATYACAKAAAGRARQAAEYAAYAAVYGQGGYGATSDQTAFEPEHEWQAAQLRRLLDT